LKHFVFILLLSPLLSYAQTGKISMPDSIQPHLDTIKIANLKLSIPDSIPRELGSKKDSLFAIGHKPEEALNKIKAQVDSLHQNVQARLDSLLKLSRPDTLLTKMLSGITAQTDSLKTKLANLQGKIKTPEELTKLQTTVEGSIGKTQQAINDKLSILRTNGINDLPASVNLPTMSSLKLPSGSTSNLELSNVSLPSGLSNVQLPSTNVSDINMPNIDLPTSSIGDVKMPNTNLPSTDLSLPNIQQPSLPSMKGMEGVGDYASRIGEVSEQIKGVEEDIKKLSSGNLDEIKNTPELLEKKLIELDQLQAFKEQLALADQTKRYFDPEVAKEEMLNKAKQEAVNHFLRHEQELKAGIQKLSELKSKFPNTDGVLDLFVKRQKFMSGRPFMERFVPGLTLQFQKQQSFWLDINPHIGFKVSPRWITGLGWNERIAYDFDDNGWDKSNHIYGLRSFVHFKVKENFYFKADVEVMNTLPKSNPTKTPTDVVTRQNVWSYFVGLKHDFQISKNWRMNAQMLYNIYDPKKQSPYVHRFSARLGFEIPLRKKNISKK
jgi:hypothetical protein